MRGTLVDAERLVAAVQEVGGRVPVELTNILTTLDMLNAQSVRSDPALAIVRAGAAGQLSEKKLTAMLAEAAQAQQVVDYTGEARQRIEPLLVREFTAALQAGAANDLIDSLRPQWDAAAAFIGRARSAISAESSIEHFLATTDDPDAIELWRGLDAQLRIVNQIAAVVSVFGPRTGPFSLIKEFSGGDGSVLEDRAIFCTNGLITVDSSVFRRPDSGHKSSPWFRLPLRLHSIKSAQARYDTWAATEFDRINRPRPRRLDRPADWRSAPASASGQPLPATGRGEVA